MSIRLSTALTLLAATLGAAVPETDSRMTQLADHKTHFISRTYSTRRQWEEHKSRLRQQILSAAGLLPTPARSPLHPKFVRRLEYPDYSVEVVLLETFPGYYLSGNLYRPTRRKPQNPAILLAHGHWKRGRLENLPVYSVPALAINLARQGYVVFAHDMVGYNDTRQVPHSSPNWTEALWGFHPMGLQLWNCMRVLDFLQSLPDVDPHRIAATGASGGASQTFLLAAVDDRVAVAAPVNMVSAYMQGGDPCEEAPNLRLETSNVEIAAMIAPRPMLVVSSTRDWTRHTPVEEFPAIRRIYELYGAAEQVHNVHIDAEHNYNRESREAVYRFLAKSFQTEILAAELVDQPVAPPADETLLAYPRSELPSELGSTADIFQTWKAAATLQAQNATDAQELRDALRSALSVEWPAESETVIHGNHVVISRPGRRDRVVGAWFDGKGAPILIVHSSGAAAAQSVPSVVQLLKSGRPVLIIEPFTSSPNRAVKQRVDEYFYSYNRSDAAERVQDILTALSFLRSRDHGRPTLVGLGNAGIWCLFAGAVSPVELDIVADLNGFGGSDQDFRDRFFVPGIQRAGGLPAALKLTNHVRAVIDAQ